MKQKSVLWRLHSSGEYRYVYKIKLDLEKFYEEGLMTRCDKTSSKQQDLERNLSYRQK